MAKAKQQEAAPREAQIVDATVKLAAGLTPTPLNAAMLRAFYSNTVEGTAQAERTRLGDLGASFQNTDISTVRSATKDYRGEAGSEGFNTRKVRSSEICQIYGAFRFGKMPLGEVGYHATVEKARETLKAEGIRWTGDKIPEKWEKDAKLEAKKAAEVAKHVVLEKARIVNTTGEEPTADQLEAVREKTLATLDNAQAQAVAGAIVRKGLEYAVKVHNALTDAIAAEENRLAEAVQQEAA